MQLPTSCRATMPVVAVSAVICCAFLNQKFIPTWGVGTTDCTRTHNFLDQNHYRSRGAVSFGMSGKNWWRGFISFSVSFRYSFYVLFCLYFSKFPEIKLNLIIPNTSGFMLLISISKTDQRLHSSRRVRKQLWKTVQSLQLVHSSKCSQSEGKAFSASDFLRHF